MECRELKPYKGFYITKSWVADSNGRIIKSTVIYDAVDFNDAVFDAKKTLNELKKSIENYVG